MATEPKRIHVGPDTAVADLLQAAQRGPVILEQDGVLYNLTPATSADPNPEHDAQAVQRVLRRTAGAFTGLDTEQLKRDILAQRDQDSHGRPA